MNGKNVNDLESADDLLTLSSKKEQQAIDGM